MSTSLRNETPFRAGVLLGAVLLIVGVARLRFCYDVTLPGKPPKPTPRVVTPVDVNQVMERNPQAYAEFLAKDSATYAIDPRATPESMAKVFKYERDTTAHVLDPADRKATSVEVLGLKLSIAVSPISGTPNRQMILTIENPSDRFYAYRVQTRPSHGTQPCHQKRDLAHNALALGPGAVVRRSECLYTTGWSLTVSSVERVELPPLAFHYLSQVPAEVLGLEPRTARGHRPEPGEQLCQVFHSAEIARSLESGKTTWRDMIDFYARHRCQTYSFPAGYKAFDRDGQEPLPASGQNQ